MKKILLFSLLFVLLSCDDGEKNSTVPENCTNTTDDDGDGMIDCDDSDCAGWSGCIPTCEGDAPLANLQNGVCAGVVKICDATSLTWVEPEYELITNYESIESLCDSIDNNCDGNVDEGITFDFYPDVDGDGYGDFNITVTTACAIPANHVINNLDCNDASTLINPDATEICDGVDNNCDNTIDTDAIDKTFWYLDSDNDSYGDPLDSVLACTQPATRVANSIDCNPTDPNHWNDCSTCTDNDNDGYGTGCNLGADCDDTIATGVTCNASCTTYHQDSDSDGYGNPAISLVRCTMPVGYVLDDQDCDDTITTGVTCNASCTNYYQDSDIDGYGDPAILKTSCTLPVGHVSNNLDCDDASSFVKPGATEICDGIDNDCDSIVDAGMCNSNSICEDEDGSVAPYCICDIGFMEVDGSCESIIVINELDPNGRWVELYNRSNQDVAMSNLSIESLVDGPLTINGTVLANGFYMLDPFDTDRYGDIVYLKNSNENVVDSADFAIDSGKVWGRFPSGIGEFDELGYFTYDSTNEITNSIDWCGTMSPDLINVKSNVTTESIYGEIWIDGVTGKIGGTNMIYSQLCYSNDLVNLTNPSCIDSTYLDVSGDNDRFSTTLTIAATGIYKYYYQFSKDGTNWTSCNLNSASGDATPAIAENSGVLTIGKWDKFSAGGGHTCGIKNGNLYCWGTNYSGELGLGDMFTPEYSNYKITPTRVGLDSDWEDIKAAMGGYTCGIKSGYLYCWGSNSSGQLGLGDSTYRDIPTQVGLDSDWESMTIGGYDPNTCGIKSGYLYCWGFNYFGQLGLGDSGEGTERDTPTQVGLDSDWEHISSNGFQTCGIKTGRLYCWGDNQHGQLGLGDTTYRDTPTQVGVDIDWENISSAGQHTCGIKSGQLFCWGLNDNGQLGMGDSTERDIPTKVGIDSGWEFIGLGWQHTCGIKSGELYCWGDNDGGQLGLGDSGNGTDRDTPTQVGVDIDWENIKLGDSHTCGMRSEQLFCWGYNEAGQLGLGDELMRDTPTEIH
jgi:Putative metal-binding motif/Regulator of chromosome condensation (RCC1) repeat